MIIITDHINRKKKKTRQIPVPKKKIKKTDDKHKHLNVASIHAEKEN